MKRIFACLLFAGTIVNCLGQGFVQWIAPSTAVTAQTNAGQYYNNGTFVGGAVGNTAPASSGLIYYYELLYNTQFTGSQISPPDYYGLFNGTWLDTGLTATNSNSAGRLTPINPNVSATVPWASGTTNNIMLVGWSANLGTDWLTVSNVMVAWAYTGPPPGLYSSAFFGKSTTGYISPGTEGPGASLFGASATPNGLRINSPNMQLYSMPVTITPEPSTLALAGLGGLSIFCFRRLNK